MQLYIYIYIYISVKTKNKKQNKTKNKNIANMSDDVQRGQRRRHRRRNFARDRERLQEYTVCVICLDEHREDTNRLLCCRKFVHELCMREWFTTGRAGFICPHCKQPQIPLSIDDPLPPYIAPRHYVDGRLFPSRPQGGHNSAILTLMASMLKQ